GEGKRMRSRQPKVFHPLCGRPLIAYPLRAAHALADRFVVVAPPETPALRDALPADIRVVEQRERLGTGHAVLQAKAECGDGTILVLPADMPLISAETLDRLVAHHREARAINDRKQLAVAAAVQRARILDRLMESGVTVLDPATSYVEDTVTIGTDTIIYPHVVIEGPSVIGSDCVVGAGSHLTRAT